MASFSLGMLGILLMLDICFIVNYFVIRALRQWKDQTQNCKEKGGQNVQKASESSNADASVNPTDISDYAFAWLLGMVRLEAFCVKRFPGWRPLPFQVGILLTSILTILSCVVLSPDLIATQLGISAMELDADLCVTEAFVAGIKDLDEQILNMTQLTLAQKQHQLVQDYHAALINDTSLYGVPPFQCPSRQYRQQDNPNQLRTISGLKSDWNNSSPLFPGYCEEALEAALESAEQRECYYQICDCPTLPNTAVFQMMGLADKEFCGEVCIDVPYPCPGHSNEDYYSDSMEEQLQDYRYRQLLAALEKQQQQQEEANSHTFSSAIPESAKTTASETAEKILHQVNIASYIYIGYSCLALFFPSPLILFRMPYWVTIKRFLFGVQKPYFICCVVAIWWGLEYFRAIWYSPDLQIMLANLSLGLRDPCFVDPEYVLERQRTIQDVCQQLMPLEPQFNTSLATVKDVLREVAFFADSCQCSFPNEYLSRVLSSLSSEYYYDDIQWMGFTETMNICGNNSTNYGDDAYCTISTPGENITFIGNSSICTNNTAARHLLWEFRDDDSTENDAKTDWYSLWVASGFLSMLLIKFAIANMGLSLMNLADPFSCCAGEFLWMPTDFGTSYRNNSEHQERLQAMDETGRALSSEVIQKWFQTKQRALVHIALSKTFFWGFLVHLCMYNLFQSVYQEVYSTKESLMVDSVGDDDSGNVASVYELLERRDQIVLGACLGFALLVVSLGTYTVYKLKRLIDLSTERENLPDTDSESVEDSEKGGGFIQSVRDGLLQEVIIEIDAQGQ